MPKKQEKMLLVPSFPRRTRPRQALFPRRRSARASLFLPTLRQGEPRPLRSRSAARRGTWNRFRTTASFHCLAVLNLRLPRRREKNKATKGRVGPTSGVFPRRQTAPGPVRPCPFPMLTFPPHKNFRSNDPLKGPLPEVAPKRRPARKRAARRSAEGPPPAASIPEPSENTR